MNNIFNGEEMLEAGKTVVKKAADQTAKQVTTTAQNAMSQITGTGSNENLAGNQQNTQQGVTQDDTAKDIVKNLYGLTSTSQSTPIGQQSQLPNGQVPQTPEEAKKIAETRKLLLEQHNSTYFNDLNNPPKPPEPQVAERLEQEKQEEEMKKIEKFQEEQKKNEVPLAVQMGAQRAEKFPGASG